MTNRCTYGTAPKSNTGIFKLNRHSKSALERTEQVNNAKVPDVRRPTGERVVKPETGRATVQGHTNKRTSVPMPPAGGWCTIRGPGRPGQPLLVRAKLQACACVRLILRGRPPKIFWMLLLMGIDICVLMVRCDTEKKVSSSLRAYMIHYTTYKLGINGSTV